MSMFKKKKNKLKIEDETLQLLENFKNTYAPKNQVIEEIIYNAETDLKNGQIPQVVLQKFVGAIYSVCFVEKIKVGNDVSPILNRMDKLSRSNGWLPFGGLFNLRM